MAECPCGEGVAICVDDPHDAARFFSQRFGICGRTELLFLINRDFFYAAGPDSILGLGPSD